MTRSGGFEPAAIGVLLRSRLFHVLARIALTCAYWWGGLAKLLDCPAALDEARHFGLQPAWLVVIATVVVELGGSALLIAGRWAWFAAGALGVFTAIATLMAHQFWTIADPAGHFTAFNAFLEHIGLIGGLALAASLAEIEKNQER
jgi:uncharacterized membrane protein YphA (DoxX/SURF4 family)